KQLARSSLIASGAGAVALRALDDDGPPADLASRQVADRIASHSSIARAAMHGLRSAAAARALATLALLECEPALAGEERPEIIAALAAMIERGARQSASRDVRPTDRAKRDAHEERRDRDTNDIAGDDPDAASQDDRAGATTAFGGLLFLLHLVRALELPKSVLAEPRLAARSLRWTMHQIAMALTPIDAADPAALAFAGVAPRTRPPSVAEPPATRDEMAAIEMLRDALIAALRARINATRGESDAAIVRRVVTRTAKVVADPAWIELRFSINDATTDLRRAALDFDPGWLPWLGVVVRFAYV
ncbi:MAG: hypothetical protein M3081_07790, partial [Gemmatimonadota bacterium]|nr:hypothetical protein [Gemmatimonadota bacterium]